MKNIALLVLATALIMLTIMACSLMDVAPAHGAARPRACVGRVVRTIEPGVQIVRQDNGKLCQRSAPKRTEAGDAMIYTAVAKIDVNANQPYDTDPEYIWIDIDHLSDATHVCAVQILDTQGIVAILDRPTAAELVFVRNVVRLSEVYAAAMVWRDTIKTTQAEELARLRLRKLLQGEQ
jgi:hypothetical protein